MTEKTTTARTEISLREIKAQLRYMESKIREIQKNLANNPQRPSIGVSINLNELYVKLEKVKTNIAELKTATSQEYNSKLMDVVSSRDEFLELYKTLLSDQQE